MARVKCNDVKILTRRYEEKIKNKKPEYRLVGVYNDKVVDIEHSECKNIFSLNPKYFLYYGSCPYCSASSRQDKKELRDRNKMKKFKDEVESLTNGEYIVTGSSINSKTRKIEVCHKACGYKYEVRMCMFRKGRRCPICRKTKFKNPADYQLDFNKVSNGNFRLETPYKKSNEKVKIYHYKCSNSFEILPGQFLKDARCSICEKQKKTIKIENASN